MSENFEMQDRINALEMQVADLDSRLAALEAPVTNEIEVELLAELRQLRVENADLNAKLTIARDGLRELRESLEAK